MKNLLKYLVVCFIFTAFTLEVFAVEDVAFVKMKDWKIEKIGTSKLVLTTKAVFFNPNKAKVALTAIDFNVLFGDTKAGKIEQFTSKVKIKKQSAFEIPLRIEVNPETNAWGYITGILSALTMQDFVVNVRGYLKVKVLGIPLKINVDESEKMNLKDIITGD